MLMQLTGLILRDHIEFRLRESLRFLSGFSTARTFLFIEWLFSWKRHSIRISGHIDAQRWLLWMVGTRRSSSSGVGARVGGAKETTCERCSKKWDQVILPSSCFFCCSSACLRLSFLLGSSSFFGAVFGAGLRTRFALPRFSVEGPKRCNANGTSLFFSSSTFNSYTSRLCCFASFIPGFAQPVTAVFHVSVRKR